MQSGGSLKHVEHIILAEFDIDKGSSITAQYPTPTNAETQFLAEMMLPDGVHKRQDDWTVFFLNRNGSGKTGGGAPPQLAKPKPLMPPFEAFIYEFDENSGEGGGWVLKGKKFLYLLTRSIEIRETDNANDPVLYAVTKHPELDFTQLEPMFSCVVLASGLALGFRFSTNEAENNFSHHVAGIKNSSDAPEEPVASSAPPPSSASASGAGLLYCINRVTNQKDTSVRRGAVVKALALCTPHHFFHIFKPVLILALDNIFKCKDSSSVTAALASLYNAINNMDLSKITRMDDYQRLITRRAQYGKTGLDYEAIINYGVAMKATIPTCAVSDEVGDYQVITLVQKFGAGIMTIFNAVLAEKRVLFVGYEGSAEEICSSVLSTLKMMCPPLHGLVSRTFPYANIAQLDFLSVPGYIAGVANPIFETHQEWWDVLCNLSNGSIQVNPQTMNVVKGEIPPLKPDVEFFNQLNQGVLGHYGEDYVRTMFENYLTHILDVAMGDEEFANEGAQKAAFEANKKRIDDWKKTKSYDIYREELTKRRARSVIKDRNVPRLIKKLRVLPDIHENEMIHIYNTFINNIQTPEQLTEFLSLCPESQGGLYPVAVSLFSSSKKVRDATVELFKRLDSIKNGNSIIDTLNFFLFLAYKRQLAASSS